MNKFTPLVYYNNNSIYIKRMDSPACVTQFIQCIKKCIDIKLTNIDIFVKAHSVFPNACLPISCIMQFCKSTYNMSFQVHYCSSESRTYLLSCGFENPLNLTPEEIKLEVNPFNKIYVYNDSLQVSELTQTYINAISRESECAKGVIDGLIWCLNEVMDNVLVQYHPSTKHIAICIFDYGIGIYKTLKGSKHNPKTELDAISLSIQEGIGDGKGQGNGLYGLYGIVENNKGRLTITSGQASLFFQSNNELKKYDSLPVIHRQHAGTIVDFQLDLSNNIDIKTIFKSIGGFDGFDIRLDDMLTENDYYKYDVYNNCQGTATRDAGRTSYNDVLNIINRKNSPIILDFSNVHNVSSSYIDEFIAKLVIKMGFYRFNQMVKIIGMNETIEHLCNRAISMRVYDEWENKFYCKSLVSHTYLNDLNNSKS